MHVGQAALVGSLVAFQFSHFSPIHPHVVPHADTHRSGRQSGSLFGSGNIWREAHFAQTEACPFSGCCLRVGLCGHCHGALGAGGSCRATCHRAGLTQGRTPLHNSQVGCTTAQRLLFLGLVGGTHSPQTRGTLEQLNENGNFKEERRARAKK